MADNTQGSLFDSAPDKADAVFRTMKEKFGIFPISVWEIDHQDKTVHAAEVAIGDIGLVRGEAGAKNLSYKTMGQGDRSTRIGSLSKPVDDESVYRGKVTVSIFSPAVCQWILNLFAPANPAGKICYDPFAGGGTRAIMAANHGLTYVGMEIRADEVAAVNARAAKCGVADKVTIHHGDARTATPVEEYTADLIVTCPPYYNLETYEGGDGDLSMLPTYERFLEEMEKVVLECRRIAKRGITCVWVVGIHRHPDDGRLYPLNHDIANLHRKAGFKLYEEVILYHKNNGAIQRVGMFEAGKGNKAAKASHLKGAGHLVRLHEYVLVFKAPN